MVWLARKTGIKNNSIEVSNNEIEYTGTYSNNNLSVNSANIKVKKK
jgi:hypothetical protein